MNAYTIRVVCPGDKGRGHESRTANVVLFEFGTDIEGVEKYWGGWHTTTAPSRAQKPEKRGARSLKHDQWWADIETEAAKERRRTFNLSGEILTDKDLKGIYTCPLCRDNLQVSDWEKLCQILDRLRANDVEKLTLANLRMIYETHTG